MEDLKNIINHFQGELYDLCYFLLKEYDNNIETFKFVCEHLIKLPENEDKTIKIDKYFELEEINEYSSLYEDIVKGIMKTTIKRCDFGIIKQDEFYRVLWESYVNNFSTTKEKAFAFYRTILDKKIPYIYLGKPVSMDNEKFRELNKKNEEILKKIEYIFNSTYEQKTERASLVLHVLESIDDFQTKVVALVRAFALDNMRTENPNSVSIEDLIKRIDAKIEELEEQEPEESEKVIS